MGKYVYNSILPFVRTNFNGNRLVGDRFTNYPYPDPAPELKTVLKWKLSANPQRNEKKQDRFALRAQFLPGLPDTPGDFLIWLGHASFFIRMSGVQLLIDPLVGSLPLIGRKVPFPIAPAQLQPIDYILISHAHRDHYDTRSLRKLLKHNPTAEVLGPLRISLLLKKLAFSPVCQEAGWYQPYALKKSLKIVFLPAVHWHRRGLFDLNKILWGSFHISNGTSSIFFGGDTAYHKHFRHIADIMGPVDVSLLPIGAYKPEYLMKQAHLNPEEAVMAANHLQSKTLIPMHYGTLDLSDEPLGEPLRWLRQLEAENKLAASLSVLQPGEVFYL
ncbi:MBL fold metallo-hydrolase [Cesiribacter andamanensis]|uniref:Metal-dependent hydrolase n=1 Tax=Cesiribacter andamanensis AMV16 TaxID=1279009 RepID=M7N2J6_9BACT|nr:MBL fold metallo-hydrolase [Cesiribacter andamanensis]EMR02893.1 metal-dependent hydrolase [Cesiribacter andamanensis AMV16]